MTAPARTTAQRVADTLHRLEHDVDAWVATASPEGEPCMVPLSFLWDGATLLFSTAPGNPTARNLAANGRARVGVGPTRDVVLIECSVESVPAADAGAGGRRRVRGEDRVPARPAVRVPADDAAVGAGVARGQRARRPRPTGTGPGGAQPEGTLKPPT